MARTITFKGNPLTLAGRVITVGRNAPDFQLLSQDLTQVGLADFSGKVKLITSFPSLDTPVCDLQVKEFNKAAASLSKEAVIIGVSADLPFAQKRFCTMNDIAGVKVLSDYRTFSFGFNYGLLIKELKLLARAIVIVDAGEAIRYLQIVPELTSAPDYKLALAALAEVIKEPRMAVKDAVPSKCTPCEQGAPSLPIATVEKLLAKHRGWMVVEGGKITKEWRYKDFAEAKLVVDMISAIAEAQGHHPVITLSWGKVKITLTTHAAGGLTDNDFIMARIIDEAAGSAAARTDPSDRVGCRITGERYED